MQWLLNQKQLETCSREIYQNDIRNGSQHTQKYQITKSDGKTVEIDN